MVGRYLEFKRPAGTSTWMVAERAGRHTAAARPAGRFLGFRGKGRYLTIAGATSA